MRKALLILIPLLLILGSCSSNKRNPNLYLIPKNFVGWVQIIYNQEGFAEVKKTNGKNIYTIPESGILKTSTPDAEYGVASDEFYYYDEQNKQQKLNVDKMIHGQNIGKGESADSSGKTNGPAVQSFFVGTENDLQNMPYPGYPDDLLK
ncbi:hypothetical protein AMQ84_20485 [Paenibacillus riograndensis]|uniref:DUF6843 domain-containing protein n=1 Tax=Paenibacillus riograndensis TaxID=483937 RepID=A0A132TSR2_9BACL|nr:hypothetical protein [Paenibacillus riograndensis]KWX74379.1 hypothetical protein AMQ84_20485 [Paenibacillus riograndensis]